MLTSGDSHNSLPRATAKVVKKQKVESSGGVTIPRYSSHGSTQVPQPSSSRIHMDCSRGTHVNVHGGGRLGGSWGRSARTCSGSLRHGRLPLQ